MILKNLNILRDDDSLKNIVIEKEIITRIEPTRESNISNDVALDLEGCIAFPGLVNSHDHLEFNLYDKPGNKLYSDYTEWGEHIHSEYKDLINEIESVPADLRFNYGIIKNLISGVTTVAHHGSFNKITDSSPIEIIKNCTSLHSVKLGGKWKLKLNWIKNSEPYAVHIGEGVDKRSYDEINEFNRNNFFKRKVIGIHAVAMNEEQAKHFQAIVWCPDSNLFLFNKTADVNLLKRSSKILFGTDSTLTSDWNIWDHLRLARELRLLDDNELIDTVTVNGAEAWGLNDLTGIKPGKRADIIVAKMNSSEQLESFYNCNPEEIILILKNGQVIFFDESVKNDVLRKLPALKDFYEITIEGKKKFIPENLSKLIDSIRKYYPAFESFF